MSNSAPTFDDSYAPQIIEGIEVVEVQSDNSARRHVVIHPLDGRVQSLDVKDYFVWQKLNGKTSLAHVTQDYYGKFKVLPTQHIIEIVRSWYENGFLTECEDAWAPQKENLKGWWGIPLPSIILRNLIGPLASILIHRIVVISLLVLTMVGLGVMLFQRGPLFLHQPFDELPVPQLLLVSILGMYISYALQIFIRFGGLWKGHTYRNDRILLGAWICFPGLVIGERGFMLKSYEQVNIVRLLEWMAPLMLCVSLSMASSTIMPLAYRSLTMTLALGASVFFVVHSCPFLRKSWVKCLEAFAQGVSMRELREAFSQNATVFSEDYGVRALNVVKGYMASVMVWVVIGSSFLLYTLMRVADLLGIWGRTTMGLGEASFRFWQILVYAPILLGFFWMLWKLVEPFLIRLMQYPSWKEEQLLAPVMSLLVLLLIPAQLVFAPLLMKCALGILLCSLIVVQWSPSKKVGLIESIWPIVFMVLLSLSLGKFLLPEEKKILNWLLPSVWLLWSIFIGFVFSVRCTRWLLRWLGTAVIVFAILMILVPGEWSSPFALYAMSFSIWTSLVVWSFSGIFGIQMLPGALASLLLGVSLQVQPAWVYLAIGLVMSAMPVLGWSRCRRIYIQKLSYCLCVEADNSPKGAMKTLRVMASLFMGPYLASDIIEHYRSQPRLLKAFNVWLQPWLGIKGWRACLRIALNSSPWEERVKFQEDTNVKVLSRLENPQTFDIDKRVRILHSQFCFKGFKKAELEMLANYLEIAEFEEDEFLLHQGSDAHPYLEIVVKGRVILERRRPGGENSILAELGSMESLRSEDLFKSNPYDFSARALENVVTVRLYRQHLLAWVNNHRERMQLMIESVKLADMIMNLSLFRDFSPSQVRLVMEKLKKKEVAAGFDIIKQGEEGDEFFLLDEGRVEIIIHGKAVAQLGSGSYFGEIALLEKCKRTATVRSLVKATLYSLEQSDFDRFFAVGRGAQVLKNVSSLRSGEAVI